MMSDTASNYPIQDKSIRDDLDEIIVLNQELRDWIVALKHPKGSISHMCENNLALFHSRLEELTSSSLTVIQLDEAVCEMEALFRQESARIDSVWKGRNPHAKAKKQGMIYEIKVLATSIREILGKMKRDLDVKKQRMSILFVLNVVCLLFLFVLS